MPNKRFLILTLMIAGWHSAAVFADSATPTKALNSTEEWSWSHAAHLLRRAGFGGTPDQIEFLQKLGREKAVAYLVNYEKVAFEPIPIRVESFREKIGGRGSLDREERQKRRMMFQQASRLQLARVVRWWTETMVTSPRPLEEKLTLFWHGHFTSGFQEVKSSYLLFEQNKLLRRNASGNFRTFLTEITDDPAMILYLNTQQNRKSKPNENYARELLELFTMGTGNYTERDIKEAARAFTGISLNLRSGDTIYRDRQHDFGEKTFLGRTGKFGPSDVIDIILEQPATAEFISRKLWSFFVYEDPEPEIVEALAAVLRKNNYELKPLLTVMFSCDAFYSERARFTHIKSPVELMVGTLRMLEMPPVDTESMVIGMRSMGQMLMQPPNVKGWDGGAAWITTSTLYNRYNVLGQLLTGTENSQVYRQRERRARRLMNSLDDDFVVDDEDICPPQPELDPTVLLKNAKIDSAEELVDHLVKRLLQRQLPPERKKTLLDAVQPHFNGSKIDSKKNDDAVRGLIHLILSMPEYQLS